ncbi:hypothetical protein [Amycolatopsis sp. NPDC051128]|uniref:hypothetical protein n=1 Tax=Amycolatopsis sp. NPDC051128 TaxID=3155412 RepID=UPI0034371E08
MEIAAAPSRRPDEVLRLAASVDQLSPHVLAEAITAEARARNLALSLPQDVVEEPGRGARATVEGRRIEVGRPGGPLGEEPWTVAVQSRARLDGAAVAWLTVDGTVVGAVLLRDPLRSHSRPYSNCARW